MARSPRCDGPGIWHHVMNRGIAKRTVFEDARDVRFFLSRLARAVRAGWIEVHCFCVMTTHFHLLVRSPGGELSRAMCRVLDDYVRWFNRGRMRDGPLFRGRFRSRPVESHEYRCRLVHYIDANPTLAGMAVAPGLYPHGSARWYARNRGPIWLDRSWIEAVTREDTLGVDYDPRRYLELFAGPLSPALVRVIERRIETGVRGPDPLDDLIDAAPEQVLDWMRRKAALADGTNLDLPVCDAHDVRGLIAERRVERSEWRLTLRHHSFDAWQLLEVALLRGLCGLAWTEIGSQVEISDRVAMRGQREHERLLNLDAECADAASRLASEAIARCYGSRRRSSPSNSYCS